jgi:hypothetical protein
VTIHPGRHSAPSLLVVGRGLAAARQGLLERWTEWLIERGSSGQGIDPAALTQPLGIILDLLVHMSGPLRREARESWYAATELYGRLAEARGLSAGEVVEELQHLRELVIVEMADLFVALPARQQLPAVLRISRVLDTAVTNGVVGYTDALVASMFSREGVPVPTTENMQNLLDQLCALEADVRLLDERSAG